MAVQGTLLLVYGTLKRGQPQEDVMTSADNGAARFVGRAQTISQWPLVIASKYNIPFLLLKEGIGHRIWGDVFEVDSRKLQFLDKFESCPTYYERKLIDVEMAGHEVTKAYAYFLRNFKSELLQRQMHSNYNSYGDHGLRFVLRSERVREQSDNYEDTDDE